MFAVLHAADFALQSVIRTEPGLASRSVALFDDTRNKSLVRMANLSARTVGVELGMNAPQAVARCAALIIRTPNATAENEARAALHSAGFALSAALEDTAPGVCTVDLRGSNPARLMPSVHEAIAQLSVFGLTVTA